MRARRNPPHAAPLHTAARRRRTPHTAVTRRARQPLLHVGELEQLEKDLEKRRAPCVRVDGGGGCGSAPPPRCHRCGNTVVVGRRALLVMAAAAVTDYARCRSPCLRARNIIAALGYVAESQRTLTLI